MFASELPWVCLCPVWTHGNVPGKHVHKCMNEWTSGRTDERERKKTRERERCLVSERLGNCALHTEKWNWWFDILEWGYIEKVWQNLIDKSDIHLVLEKAVGKTCIKLPDRRLIVAKHRGEFLIESRRRVQSPHVFSIDLSVYLSIYLSVCMYVCIYNR